MKILGYVLKGMSLYIFVAVARAIYSVISGKVPANIVSRGEEKSYIIGQVVIIVIAGFLAYKLFQFSSKMIQKASLVKVEKV
jgi:putative effector of murein hydrolase LrgA (UPF0299 family)